MKGQEGAVWYHHGPSVSYKLLHLSGHTYWKVTPSPLGLEEWAAYHTPTTFYETDLELA